jgi:hypothetical protein
MTILNLKTWLTSTKFTAATYDDTTGDVTFKISSGITKDENVIKEVILGLEDSGKDKRSNLNSPISQKSFPDNPQYSFVNRSDTNGNTENQIEYFVQLSLWLKAPDLLNSDAVNDND